MENFYNIKNKSWDYLSNYQGALKKESHYYLLLKIIYSLWVLHTKQNWYESH